MNQKINDGNCFHYAINLGLNHEQIKKYLQRIIKNCTFYKSVWLKRYEHNFYGGADGTKNFCADLKKEHAAEVMNYEKRKCCH